MQNKPISLFNKDNTARYLPESLWYGRYRGGVKDVFTYLTEYIKLQAYQNVNDIVEAASFISRFDIPIYHRYIIKPINLSSDSSSFIYSEPLVYGDDMALYGQYGDSEDYRKVFKYGDTVKDKYVYKFKIDGILKTDVILDKLINPSRILISGVDFTISNGVLEFKENPLEFYSQSTVSATSSSTVYSITLWAVGAYTDDNYVYDVFADSLGYEDEPSEDYRKAVNSIWDMNAYGVTRNSVLSMMSSYYGCPAINDTETVVKVFYDNEYLNIITDKNVYQDSKEVLPTVSEGDIVHKDDVITTHVRLVEPLSVCSPVIKPAHKILYNTTYEDSLPSWSIKTPVTIYTVEPETVEPGNIIKHEPEREDLPRPTSEQSSFPCKGIIISVPDFPKNISTEFHLLKDKKHKYYWGRIYVNKNWMNRGIQSQYDITLFKYFPGRGILYIKCRPHTQYSNIYSMIWRKFWTSESEYQPLDYYVLLSNKYGIKQDDNGGYHNISTQTSVTVPGYFTYRYKCRLPGHLGYNSLLTTIRDKLHIKKRYMLPVRSTQTVMEAIEEFEEYTLNGEKETTNRIEQISNTPVSERPSSPAEIIFEDPLYINVEWERPIKALSIKLTEDTWPKTDVLIQLLHESSISHKLSNKVVNITINNTFTWPARVVYVNNSSKLLMFEFIKKADRLPNKSDNIPKAGFGNGPHSLSVRIVSDPSSGINVNISVPKALCIWVKDFKSKE